MIIFQAHGQIQVTKALCHKANLAFGKLLARIRE